MKINLKESKAITLIALVITIIVLLILAAVSIAMLTGENGILTQAQNAKESTKNAGEEEKIRLAAMAAIGESLGGDIEQGHLEEELDNYFGSDGYEITPGENNGEDGFIVTIDESGNQYFVDKDGNVSQMVAGPSVTHTISPEGQVAEGDKITITITATATEGSITEIIKPDGSSVKNVTETTYEVTENGDYKFIVKQSNGGSTTHTVTITTGIEVEKFSDIYTETKEYTKDGQTAWIPEGFAVGVSSKIDDISEGLVITDKIDENHKSIGNEFVWIPVASETEYIRNTSYENTSVSAKAYTDKEYLPDGIAPTIPADSELEIPEGKTKDEAIGLINEEAERDAVTTKGGFYISRYEAGNDGSDNLISKNGATVWVSKSQEEFKEIGKSFQVQSPEKVKSAMCSGIQWDMAMKFITENDENFDVTTETSSWHQGSEVVASGQNKEDKACNIYDLESNALEYVAEKSSYYPNLQYVYRGGGHDNYSGPASYRYNHRGTADSIVSFRFVLYVM